MTDPRYMRRGLDFARGKMIEECGELCAALGKSLRWGWLSSNPEIADGETNAEWIAREMQDVRGALDNLQREMAANIPHPLAGRACTIKAQDISPAPTPEEVSDRDNALRSW